MKLENVTITATIKGEPVMVILDDDQIALRVAKLDPKVYTLSKPSFANK